MLTISASDICDIVSGTLIGGATGTELITGNAVIDSRSAAQGDLFAAFEGNNVDGHRYVQAATEQGAALCLVSRDVDVPAIKVDDVQRALTHLAKAQLERARATRPDFAVVAVTGSAGKTGTKDLLGYLLRSLGETVAPSGSLNNELGVPLTVLSIRESTRFLVLEMGARGVGHISYLTDFARPDIAVVLNVGSAHLGEFGSVDAIARAKGELVEALDPAGAAVLYADDPYVRDMAERSKAPVVFWGEGQGDLQIHNLRLDDFARASFDLEITRPVRRLDGSTVEPGSVEISSPLLGEHQARNVTAASAAALVAGVSPEDLPGILRDAHAVSGGRMEVLEAPHGITIINDAYNANPDSMRQALRTLAHLGEKHRTIAVLGEMLELGDEHIALHDGIGRVAVRLNISQLIVVGRGAMPIHQGASLEGSFGGESRYVEDLAEAQAVLEQIVEPGDVVLVKSSHGAGLRTLVEPLMTYLRTHDLAHQASAGRAEGDMRE